MKVLILFIFIISISQANEGKSLHNESCVACHTDSVYKKGKRKITSLKSLKSRVTACNNNPSVDAGWFPDEEKEVAKYLNKTYYHF